MKITKIRMIRLAKQLLPPIVSAGLERVIELVGAPMFEFVPEGWAREGQDARVTGWNVESVRRTYQAKWDEAQNYVKGVSPLGIAFEAKELSNDNLVGHNLVMMYGYVLGLASRGKGKISILDWGGGVGHYGLLAGALLPDVGVEYHCKEVPLVCDLGRKLLPTGHFYDSDSGYAGRRFDLVMASGSLHYAQAWEDVLGMLSRATGCYLYITRLPVVVDVASYTMLQRPYQFGYDTEYLSWCINRAALLNAAKKQGLHVVREFFTGESIRIARAPEQCRFRGFLFRADGSAEALAA